MGLYLQKIKFLYSSYLTVIRFVYDSSFYLILYESSLKALIFVNTARFFTLELEKVNFVCSDYIL